MQTPINWVAPYTLTKDRIIYTYDQHHVPGVHSLARHLFTSALPFVDWHYHENCFEFSVATKGCLTFSTETAPYKFSGGDVFISFPNEVHGTDLTPICPGELYWFQLNISDPSHFLFLNEQAAADMIEQIKKIPHHVVQTESKETYPLIKQAFSLAQNNRNPQLIATYLQLFLHLLIVYSQKEQFRLSPDIGRTLDYILDNITIDFSLDDLAKMANLSLSQYKQKFKKQLGISPRRFINQEKIEYSKSLLQDGMSITDIAMQLSFNTSGYYSAVFKKYTRQTPSEYIKAQTENP